MNAWKMGELFLKVSPLGGAAMAPASGARVVTSPPLVTLGMLGTKQRPDGVDSFGEPFWMEMDWNDARR